MMRSRLSAAMLGTLLAALGTSPVQAWDRGNVDNFATIPFFTPSGPGGSCPGGGGSCTSDIEGIAVGPDGTVYSASFGFNAAGALGGYGQFFIFSKNGRPQANFAVTGSTPHLIGMIYQNAHSVLVADLGNGIVWKVDPTAKSTTMFAQVPTIAAGGPGVNALAIDKAGNVYISDSFQGAIWKTGPNGGTPTMWVQSDLLLPTGNPGATLIPPFGANGIAFNNEGTALYVMNTAYHSVIEIPVNAGGTAGTATTLTTGINAPDGIAIDRADNLWIAANQGDEMVEIDRTGKVVAKLGDFDGVSRFGAIDGLLFPASPAFSPDGRTLYVTNLALYLPYAGVPSIAVDSGWTLQVKQYNIASIRIGPQGPTPPHHGNW